MRNKFTDLQTIINGNVDIVSISETKLDASFPSVPFTLEGYHIPYRLDINNKSGGILVYAKLQFHHVAFPMKSYAFLCRLFLLRLI